MKPLLIAVGISLAALFSIPAHCEVAGKGGGEGIGQLYVFQNGLGIGSVEEEAKELSLLGYAGVSQVKGTPEQLRGMVASYRKEGLRVRSIYIDTGDVTASLPTLEALAQTGAMVELTVKKLEPGTEDAVREICDAAERFGMKVALYPHFGFAVATMPQAMDLIGRVNHPRLGVMFNLCHFLRGENPGDLEKVISGAGDRLFAVSVSGADEGGKDWSDLIKPLDKGNFSLKRLFKALEQTGFQGPVALQCYNIPGDKRANLKRSMKAWNELTTRR